jgi:hypothetical protein
MNYIVQFVCNGKNYKEDRYNMKKRILIILFALGVLFSSNILVVHASLGNDIDFNNKLIDGRDIAYMIQPGVEYTRSIPNAVKKLMYPSGMSNNLVLSPTTSYMASKLDFEQIFLKNGINAYASVYRKDSSGKYYNSTSQMDSLDWVYGVVTINDFYMNDLSKNKPDTCEAVIIHEMLHVYGLKDVSNSSSIMFGFTPMVIGVTIDANNVLNSKY